MSALEVFHFNAERIRITILDGEPWLAIADVCTILDIVNIGNVGNAVAQLDEDDIRTTDVIDTFGRTQQFRICNEPGFYDLVFQSRNPEARAFRRWVIKEVLPAIRRDGFYPTHPDLTVYAFDEVTTLIEQRAGIEMDTRPLIV